MAVPTCGRFGARANAGFALRMRTCSARCARRLPVPPLSPVGDDRGRCGFGVALGRTLAPRAARLATDFERAHPAPGSSKAPARLPAAAAIGREADGEATPPYRPALRRLGKGRRSIMRLSRPGEGAPGASAAGVRRDSDGRSSFRQSESRHLLAPSPFDFRLRLNIVGIAVATKSISARRTHA